VPRLAYMNFLLFTFLEKYRGILRGDLLKTKCLISNSEEILKTQCSISTLEETPTTQYSISTLEETPTTQYSISTSGKPKA